MMEFLVAATVLNVVGLFSAIAHVMAIGGGNNPSRGLMLVRRLTWVITLSAFVAAIVALVGFAIWLF